MDRAMRRWLIRRIVAGLIGLAAFALGIWLVLKGTPMARDALGYGLDGAHRDYPRALLGCLLVVGGIASASVASVMAEFAIQPSGKQDMCERNRPPKGEQPRSGGPPEPT